jgi:hypothetical protein
MENEYYNFMRKWNNDNNMTSFYGSDKKAFLKEWRKNKKLIKEDNEPFFVLKNEKNEPIKEKSIQEEFKNKIFPSMFEKKERNIMNLEDINIKKEEPKKIKIKKSNIIKEEPKKIKIKKSSIIKEEPKKIKIKKNSIKNK